MVDELPCQSSNDNRCWMADMCMFRSFKRTAAATTQVDTLVLLESDFFLLYLVSGI